jgi:hypothetical protein
MSFYHSLSLHKLKHSLKIMPHFKTCLSTQCQQQNIFKAHVLFQAVFPLAEMEKIKIVVGMIKDNKVCT